MVHQLTCFALFLALGVTSIACNRSSEFVQAGKRYYVSREQRSFVGAWVDCKTGGMQLASIESEEEQQALNNATIDAEYHFSDGYWIGLVAAETYTSDAWYWIDSGLRMIYTNWGSGQPSYSSNFEYPYCVRLGNFYKTNQEYQWENVNCNKQLAYVCEITAE